MPTFKCHTCGWKWEAGQSGNHDCIPRLVEQRDSVLGEWRLLKKRVAECYQRLGEAGVMDSRRMIDGINKLIRDRKADAELHEESRRQLTKYVNEGIARNREMADLRTQIAKLTAALADIRDMPEHDQDDAHRLRNKAAVALRTESTTTDGA